MCGSGSRAWPGPLAGEEAGGGGAWQGAGEGSCAEAKWGARWGEPGLEMGLGSAKRVGRWRENGVLW